MSEQHSLISRIFQRPFHWLETRRWRLIGPGLPALIVAFLVLVPTLFRAGFEDDIAKRYLTATRTALANEDYELAERHLRKLVHLGRSDDESVRFNLALVETQLGNFERAKASIIAMAPGDTVGYGPAHLWVAKLHHGQIENWETDEASSLVVHHLTSALKADPSLREAHMILGATYLSTKDYPGAIQHFSSVVDQEPRLHLTLAQLHREMKDAISAKQEFDSAASFFRERLLADPKNEQMRIELAKVYFQQGKFSTAEQILMEGVKRDKDSMLLRLALSEIYLLESNRISKEYQSSDPLFGKSLTMLGKAIQWAPNNQKALNRITDFIGLEGDVGRRARRGLEKILAEGNGTSTIHFVLGTNALLKNDLKAAETHLNLSNDLSPNLPMVMNNLAWVYLNAEQPKLKEAYLMANKAINLLPAGHPWLPSVFETRGQVLVKLERYEKALPDLTRALPYLKDNELLHRSLWKVYTELGQSSLANQHLEIAQKLTEKPR